MSITGGTVRNCNQKITGGTMTIYLTDAANVDSVVLGAAGEVTTVNMVASAVFYKFEFERDTGQFDENVTNDNAALYEQTLAFILKGRSQEFRNRIQELIDCQCGIAVIHTENTGTSWIWGYKETEEAYATGNEGTSGAAKGDANQETVTLTATATEKARTFTGTVPV